MTQASKKIDAKKIFDSSKSDSCEFLFGAHNYSQIPDSTQPEIAFIGTSNVGKSSLINAILGKKIAIVSSTPGRTRQLNFFKVNHGFNQSFNQGFVLVDMPGYGFAKAKDKDMVHWQKTALEYLVKRRNLKRLFLLIDPIKGLKDSDRDMLNMLGTAAVSTQIILTKIDKLNLQELKQAQEKLVKDLSKFAVIHPTILSSSSAKGYGIKEVQDAIVEILQYL